MENFNKDVSVSQLKNMLKDAFSSEFLLSNEQRIKNLISSSFDDDKITKEITVNYVDGSSNIDVKVVIDSAHYVAYKLTSDDVFEVNEDSIKNNIKESIECLFVYVSDITIELIFE